MALPRVGLYTEPWPENEKPKIPVWTLQLNRLYDLSHTPYSLSLSSFIGRMRHLHCLVSKLPAALKSHGSMLHIESHIYPKEAQSWRTLGIIYRQRKASEMKNRRWKGWLSHYRRDIAMHSKLRSHPGRKPLGMDLQYSGKWLKKSFSLPMPQRRRKKHQHQGRKFKEGLNPMFVSLSLKEWMPKVSSVLVSYEPKIF